MVKKLTSEKHRKIYKLNESFEGFVYGIVELKKKSKSYCFDFDYIKQAYSVGKKKKLLGKFVRLSLIPHPEVKKAMILILWDGKEKRSIAIAGRDD